MEIKNVKRLKEIKRIKETVTSIEEDKKDAVKIRKIENSVEDSLGILKSEVDNLLKEEVSFLELKKKLNKLNVLKSNLTHQFQNFEMQYLKDEFSKRHSLNMIETEFPTRLRGRDREITKKTINSSLINCIRRIRKIDKLSSRFKNHKYNELQSMISSLESKIECLKVQREELLTLKDLDEIEQTFEKSLAQISSEVSFIKLEYEKIARLNDVLSLELSQSK